MELLAFETESGNGKWKLTIPLSDAQKQEWTVADVKHWMIGELAKPQAQSLVRWRCRSCDEVAPRGSGCSCGGAAWLDAVLGDGVPGSYIMRDDIELRLYMPIHHSSGEDPVEHCSSDELSGAARLAEVNFEAVVTIPQMVMVKLQTCQPDESSASSASPDRKNQINSSSSSSSVPPHPKNQTSSKKRTSHPKKGLGSSPS